MLQRQRPGVDNASIVRTRERFVAVRDTINAITPRPDMVFVLGDVMHAAYHSTDPDFYRRTETAFSVASEPFAWLDVAVHFVRGQPRLRDRLRSSEALVLAHPEPRAVPALLQPAAVPGRRPQGLARSELGPGGPGLRHVVRFVRCGAAGMDRVAARGRPPTVVLSHYPAFLSRRNEAPGTSALDLWTLLQRSDAVKATFVGHMHRWIDLKTLGTPRDPNGSSRRRL